MESTEGAMKSLQEWLVRSCRVHPDLSFKLATEWTTMCGITEVEELQHLQQIDPSWLDHMQCSIPTLPKFLINSTVERLGRVPLISLTVEDVVMVVHKCYSSFQYDQNFHGNLVTGFNLQYITDVHSLMRLGIPHRLHAESFMKSIEEWRRIGVPVDLLSLTEEEHMRRISSIKEERGRSSTLMNQSYTLTGSSSSASNADQPNNDFGTQVKSGSYDDVSILSPPKSCEVGEESNPVVLDISSGGSVASCSAESDNNDWADVEDRNLTATSAIRNKANNQDTVLDVPASVALDLDALQVLPFPSTRAEGDGHVAQVLPAKMMAAANRVVKAKKPAKRSNRKPKTVQPPLTILSDEVIGLLSLSFNPHNPTTKTVLTPEQQRLIKTIRKHPDQFPADVHTQLATLPVSSLTTTSSASSLSQMEMNSSLPTQPQQSSADGENLDLSLTSSFHVTREGSWEYKTSLSTEGKDRRVLTFVPNPKEVGVSSGVGADNIDTNKDQKKGSSSHSSSSSNSRDGSGRFAHPNTAVGVSVSGSTSLSATMGGLFDRSDGTSAQADFTSDPGFDSSAVAEFDLLPEERKIVDGPASSGLHTFQVPTSVSRKSRGRPKRQEEHGVSNVVEVTPEAPQESATVLKSATIPVHSHDNNSSSGSGRNERSKNSQKDVRAVDVSGGQVAVSTTRTKRGRSAVAATAATVPVESKSEPKTKRSRGSVASTSATLASLSSAASAISAVSSVSVRTETSAATFGSTSSEMPTKKLRQLDLLAANCHLILTVKDEDKLAKAVNYIGASASKR